MKVLVVYAHPNPQSFNHAILDSFTKGLADAGHSFEVSDLYAMKFDPCLNPADFAQFQGKSMPEDVLAEQKKVSEAEALVFIYPVWWFSFPAILKGWIDRVLSHGFAYRFAKPRGAEGLLKDKKALLINTTIIPEENYKGGGLQDAMQKLMVGASFNSVCGIQNVKHVYFYHVQRADDETRKKYLDTAYQLGKEF
jgi:NAD(P)H dehydrogenase (quinone)